MCVCTYTYIHTHTHIHMNIYYVYVYQSVRALACARPCVCTHVRRLVSLVAVVTHWVVIRSIVQVTNKEFVDKTLAALDLVPAILLNFFWVCMQNLARAHARALSHDLSLSPFLPLYNWEVGRERG